MNNKRFLRYIILIIFILPFLLSGCESIRNGIHSFRSTVGGVLFITGIIIVILGFFRIRNFGGTIGSGFPVGRWLFSGVGLIIWAILICGLASVIYPNTSKINTVNVIQEPATIQSTALPTPTPATKNTPVQKETNNIKVIGNSDSKRYHLPNMKYYNSVEVYHRVEFNSEDEAIKAGYTKAPR